MKAYSLDLRERIVAALEEGASVVEVAQRFAVGERTVRTYRARAKAGALAPLPIPGRPPRLPVEQEEAFVALVQEKSDWTLEQLGEEWQGRSGVFLPRSTLHDHLKRLGGRFKKRVASPASATKTNEPASAKR